ncbi:OX-2 membrane glycoprotein-like isoform X2 [Corythoichthys intestinalis]|uniref:OX-2 membrane glycoprotein-like isoform X2 n=1 Tax=Corythoichthys intestinalis TaxID=161448 RepID=UPI0025A5DC24|nr:OX-2 membrane glycoprotein-like isoform X2 [Corythoichthys intestinalis]
MNICKMWYDLLLVTLLFEAARMQITGFGDTAVDYGNDAQYKCELQNQKGVQQVTWQKRLWDNSVQNVASYSKRFGLNINEPYQGKVILTEASLSSTSLTIKNVTWEDEHCYICIFNVFPEESKRKQTCLTVQGISEVKAKVQQSEVTDGTASFVFNCSATGKPAPSIRWRFSPNSTGFDQPVITTVPNDDRSFTSSQNVTLHLSGSWKGHADCVAQSGTQREQIKRVNYSFDAGLEVGGTGRRLAKGHIVVVCVCVFALATTVVAGFLFRVVRTQKGTGAVSETVAGRV